MRLRFVPLAVQLVVALLSGGVEVDVGGDAAAAVGRVAVLLHGGAIPASELKK